MIILNAPGGGATQGIKEFLQSRDENAIECQVVFPSHPNKEQQEWMKKHGVKMHVVPLFWWNSLRGLPLPFRLWLFLRHNLGSAFRLFPLWRICRIIKQEKIDMVYSGSILVIEGALAAKLSRVKHLWHIKETFGSAGRVKFFMPDKWLQRLMLGFSNHIICMSDYIRSHFGSKADHHKISVIPDGVTLERASSEEVKQFRQSLGVPEGSFVVGMVASLTAVWKNHMLFVEMAKVLTEKRQDIHFMIFGREPRRFKNPAYNRPYANFQKIRNRVELLGLDPYISWAGQHNNISLMMSSMDVLVHPCFEEPFGRVALEAMAAGTPVIGPSKGGVGETVINNKTGFLVEEPLAEKFAEQILKLIADPVQVKTLGQNAVQHVQKNFSQAAHNAALAKLMHA